MKTLKRNNVNDVPLVSLLLTLNVFTPFLVFLFLTLSFYLFAETEDLWVKVINEIIRFFFFFLKITHTTFFKLLQITCMKDLIKDLDLTITWA